MNKIKLLEEHIKFLESIPEDGMGYQIVTIKMKDGRTYLRRVVLNSMYLQVAEDECLDPSEIENIQPYIHR
jgi:hypothetical protein